MYFTMYGPGLVGSPYRRHICCLPTSPVHLMSLGKVAVTRVGSGIGPGGSLTVTPTFGSFCAKAANPPAPIPAETTAHKANLMADRMFFSPWNYGEDDRQELRQAATQVILTWSRREALAALGFAVAPPSQTQRKD